MNVIVFEGLLLLLFFLKHLKKTNKVFPLSWLLTDSFSWKQVPQLCWTSAHKALRMPEYIKTVATAERGLGKANIRAKWSHVADTVFFFQVPYHGLKCKHFFFSLAWEGVIECNISMCLKIEKSASSSVLLVFFWGGDKGKCCKQAETHQNDHPP